VRSEITERTAHSSSRGGRVFRRDLGPEALALVPCTLFWSAFIWRSSWTIDGRRWFTLFDDAMISMSYGRTLASGHGLVWYPGAPHVEGFTNPLWTLMMAALHTVGLDASNGALAVMLIGMALLAGCCLLASALVRRLGARSPASRAFAVLAVGFCYPLVYWTLRGMEVGLIAFLTLAACWLAIDSVAQQQSGFRNRHLTPLALVIALGLLTRPDYLVIAAVVIAWLAVSLPSKVRWRTTSVLTLVAVVVLGAVTTWRIWYYGAALPNTYVLKVSGIPIATRLSRGVRVDIGLLLIAFAAPALVVGIAHFRKRFTHAGPIALLVGIAAGTFAYSALVGGDAWEEFGFANRYLVSGLVVLLVAAVAAADRLTIRDGEGRANIHAVLVVSVVVVASLGQVLGVSVLRSAALLGSLTFGSLPLLVSVLMLTTTLLVFGIYRDGLMASRRAVVVCAVLALTPVVAMDLRPGSLWIRDGAFDTAADQRNVEFGQVLRSITTPRARIAFVTAGAPAYYSERRAIDLLGKNDRIIAESAPHGSFVPGHSKWDYSYSIGKLRPDVIAQLWRPTARDIQQVRAWGYVPARSSGRVELRQGVGLALDGKRFILVRRASSKVRWDKLEVVGWNHVLNVVG
jgi:arabinofuranosyltransferase